MLVEQLEALQSIQETYIAMNESTHDLSNVKTDTLTSLHALHAKEPKGTRSYDQRQRVAAELKKRGIKVQEDVMDEKFSHPNHEKLDANDNGKVDAQDFALLRKKKGLKNFKEFKESLEDLDEAHKIGNKVTIHKGTGAGITGHIGEIRRKFKGDTDPTYTIYHGDNQAVTVNKKQIKSVKD